MAFYHGKNFGSWLLRVSRRRDNTIPLVCLYTLATGRFKLGFKTYIYILAPLLERRKEEAE